MTGHDVAAFLEHAVAWADEQPPVLALGLAGSWARSHARAGSDVDLVIVVDELAPWFAEDAWLAAFGKHGPVADEDWGLVQSRRVHYEQGPEVEFGFTTVAWATPPLVAGTAEVIRDGFLVLHDPDGHLARAVAAADATTARPHPPR